MLDCSLKQILIKLHQISITIITTDKHSAKARIRYLVYLSLTHIWEAMCLNLIWESPVVYNQTRISNVNSISPQLLLDRITKI
jgi:hypothetical protein